jgi:hypothetical protein
VPQADARQRLDLDVEHRVALCLGEVAHLTLDEGEVVDDRRRQVRNDALDLCVVEAERRR